MMGSPFVKSVFQPKHLASPRPHVRAQEMSSELSTFDQETTADASTSTDYSVYDEGINDKTSAEPEKLRDADYHRPDNYAIAALDGQDEKRLISAARSPSVTSLGQLLLPRTGRLKLLAQDSDSTSSSEYDTTLQSKASSVLTSTMRVGGTKEFRPVLGIEDISVIKTRVSQDPRVSVEPRVDRGGSGASLLGQKQLLSSTPARMTGLVEDSLGVSSIHGSDAGGSMLVPRVEREILTVERVEETDESEVEEIDSNPRLSSPSSTILSHTSVPVASVPLSSPETLSRLIRAELSSLSPPSRDNTGTKEIPSLATEGSTTHPAMDSLHAVSGISTIQSGSFHSKSDGSSKLPKRSTSSVWSADTSGEIFSAVVHSKMMKRMVPYVRTPAKVPWGRTTAKATMGMKSKKRFVLASRLKVVSPPLSHHSHGEYYKGARASERSFDQMIEEGNHDDGGVFSQE